VWGRNDCGQLGLGDDISRGWPTMLDGHTVVHPHNTLHKHIPILSASESLSLIRGV
jgi:hypothetical protein